MYQVVLYSVIVRVGQTNPLNVQIPSTSTRLVQKVYTADHNGLIPATDLWGLNAGKLDHSREFRGVGVTLFC